MNTSFRVSYLCHTSVVPTISCYNFSKITCVIPISVFVLPRCNIPKKKKKKILSHLLIKLFFFFFGMLHLGSTNTEMGMTQVIFEKL